MLLLIGCSCSQCIVLDIRLIVTTRLLFLNSSLFQIKKHIFVSCHVSSTLIDLFCELVSHMSSNHVSLLSRFIKIVSKFFVMYKLTLVVKSHIIFQENVT